MAVHLGDHRIFKDRDWDPKGTFQQPDVPWGNWPADPAAPATPDSTVPSPLTVEYTTYAKVGYTEQTMWLDNNDSGLT